MSIATIRDTLAVGKQREKSGVSEVEVDGGSGIAGTHSLFALQVQKYKY